MKKYSIRFSGWELDMQGYKLTPEQVVKLEESVSSGEYESIARMGFDIEEIIGINIFEGDVFSMSRAEYLVDSTFIRVYDEDEDHLFAFDLNEMSDIEDHIENFVFDGEAHIEFVPVKNESENILFITSSSKGGPYGFLIESDEVPKPEDFSVVTRTIETLDVSHEFIEHVYFKGEKLEVEEWLDGQGRNIDIRLTKLQDLFDFWEENGIKNPYVE